MKIYKIKHYGTAPIPRYRNKRKLTDKEYSDMISDWEEIEQVSLTDWEREYYFPRNKEYNI